MTRSQAIQLIDLMKSKEVSFEPGLTDEEIRRVENKFAIRFPPDLRVFLEVSLPVSDSFPNWRAGLSSVEEADKIHWRLNWPLNGMQFDIEHNKFWMDEWGIKPESRDSQFEISRQWVATYPRLVPICSHRFISSEPFETGNPVLSIHQMDIIYYGYDLASYLANEFSFKLPKEFTILKKPNRDTRFWSQWTEELIE